LKGGAVSGANDLTFGDELRRTVTPVMHAVPYRERGHKIRTPLPHEIGGFLIEHASMLDRCRARKYGVLDTPSRVCMRHYLQTEISSLVHCGFEFLQRELRGRWKIVAVTHDGTGCKD